MSNDHRAHMLRILASIERQFAGAESLMVDAIDDDVPLRPTKRVSSPGR
jgi:hypothetical protein